MAEWLSISRRAPLVEEHSDEPESESKLPSAETDKSDVSADEQPDSQEPEGESAIDEISGDEEATTSELKREPSPPELIPDQLLNTAREVLGVFAEARPDD